MTKLGKAAQTDPVALWRHLANRLVDVKEDSFTIQARLLALLCLASEPEGRYDKRLAAALTYLGWRQRDGRPVSTDQAGWAIRRATHTMARTALSTGATIAETRTSS